VSNVFMSIGKTLDVAVFSHRAAELHIMFGGLPANDTTTMVQNLITGGAYAYMQEVADYPPLFIPADVTKWTVWRHIEIQDRFYFLYLRNLDPALTMTQYRMHTKIYDAQT